MCVCVCVCAHTCKKLFAMCVRGLTREGYNLEIGKIVCHQHAHICGQAERVLFQLLRIWVIFFFDLFSYCCLHVCPAASVPRACVSSKEAIPNIYQAVMNVSALV